MPIASFSGKVFTVSSDKVYTFDGLSQKSELMTEAVDNNKGKPSTFVKGSALDTLSFDIKLNSEYVDVRAEINAWIAMCEKKRMDRFILGNKALSKNKFLLKSVDIRYSKINNKGEVLSASLSLEFEEYIKAGKPKKTSSGGSGGRSSSKGKGSKNMVSKILKGVDDKSKKRKNHNYSFAVEDKIMADWGVTVEKRKKALTAEDQIMADWGVG